MNNQMFAMLNQLKQNPMKFIAQSRFNLPPGISADPQSILNELLRTGQVTQQQVNAAYQAAQRFR